MGATTAQRSAMREAHLAGEIVTTVRGRAAFVTITNRERHNAMTVRMWRDLSTAVRALGTRRDVAAIVVRGAGTLAFCAGADISEFRRVRHDRSTIARYDRTIAAAEEALLTSPKPTIAMMRGICAGGGAAIALSCDLRFAASDLRFSIPAARIGAIYPAPTVARLVQVAGGSAAFDLLASARVITAREALRLRLVDRLAPARSLERFARDYADQLALHSAHSIRAARLAIRSAQDPLDKTARRAVQRVGRSAALSEDYTEGIAAFLEKRPARFGSRSTS